MRMKRNVVWIMLAALLLSYFPETYISKVQAATTTTYFIQDDPVLENSASSVNPDNYAGTLTRANVLTSTSSNLTLKGVFNYVSANTMSVKVEQLVFQAPDGGSSSSAVWTTTPDRVYNSSATADTGSTNRFTASNVKLFSGFNKITFSGLQGTVLRSDTFYVLYDQVPYLTSLKATTGASDPVDLNEGASIVVATQQVALSGTAPNASGVSITVGNNTVEASLQEADGVFNSPALTLAPGKNIISLSINSPSNTTNITRTIYYYDEDQPFSQLSINHGSDGSQSLLNNNKPRLSDSGAGAKASFTIELLLPDNGKDFGDATVPGVVYANDPADPANIMSLAASPTEQEIAATGGLPAYRIVTFTTDDYDFKLDASSNPLKEQIVRFGIKYGTVDTAINTSFIYVPGEIVVKSISILKDYNGTDNIDVSIPRPALDGSEIPSSEFYILVEAASSISGLDPVISLLPFRTQNLNIDHPAGIGIPVTSLVTNTPASNTWRIYKVQGLPDGNQNLSFIYPGSSNYAEFTARVSHISQNYISIENLYDGQTFKFQSNSSTSSYLPGIKGQFVGFDSGLDLSSVSFTINGKEFTQTTAPTTFAAMVDSTTYKFDTGNILIHSTSGPLTFGENTLIFSGNYTNNGAVRTIVKKLRVYIIDTNVATIDAFQPATIPTDTSGRVPFTSTMTSSEIDRVFFMSNDIQFNTDKYVTSLKEYDLVVKGSGATRAVVRRGTEVLFDLVVPVTTTTYSNLPASILILPNYDFTGSQNGFIFRLRNLEFLSPGDHGYTLELTNGTGAVVSKTLTISRVVSPFRILSPQANVGNDIVVSKNYVHFDIEAEGATEITIGGQAAKKRQDITGSDRFVLDYIGLKPDKDNAVKITIKRSSGQTDNTSINVYYTSTIDVDSQYMEKIGTKHSVFNNKLQLTFPKGTVLKSSNPTDSIVKYYQDTNLLFGIASPKDGVVGRKNDYGNVMGLDKDKGSYQENVTVTIPTGYVSDFNSQLNRSSFTRVSNYYWISAGYGELGNPSSNSYQSATNGLPPYSYEGNSSTPLFFGNSILSNRKIVPSQRGSLTLSYDQSVVESAGTNVTVFFYNDQKQWVNLGGIVDAKKNTITVPFDDFGYYMVGKMSYGFKDVTDHTWARNILEALYAKGIMPNLRFNTFGADDLTTRGEFATLLVKAIDLPLNYDTNPSYFDIPATAKSLTWDYQHIETASRAGIVAGLDNRYFGADIKITREQAATMIARALDLKLALNDSKLASNLEKVFTDGSEIDFYAKPAAEAVNKAGIMVGLPNDPQPGQKKQTVRFDPKATMTRAQAAQIAVRLLQKHTKMFPANLN